MSGKVIEFRQRPGTPPADGYDGLRCPNCGSAWFALGSLTEDDLWVNGDVCLNSEGSVTGYSGTPHCVECQREVLP